VRPAMDVQQPQLVNEDGNLTDPKGIEELTQRIGQAKERVDELKAALDAWPDDKLGYFSLMDKCLTETVGEYKYEICFFKDAHQGGMSLGAWAGWKGQLRGSFTQGDTCGDGLYRSVSEPSRCVYEAVVVAPGACGKKSAQEVRIAREAFAAPQRHDGHQHLDEL